MSHPSQHEIANSQNFFRGAAVVDRLLDRSGIRPGDLVLDLGAGGGLISRRLALRGCRVLAVEKDPLLVLPLRAAFADTPAVRVCHADILQLRLPREPYVVFSNIPFDRTADIVRRLVGAANPPENAYLVVQREAGERFVGRPTTTLLSVLLFPWFDASLVHEFRRTDFTPVPRVDVVMLRLHKRGPPLVSREQTQLFRDFAIHLFTTCQASLSDSLAKLVGRRRAHRLCGDLGLAQATPASMPPCRWLELFHAVRAIAAPELRWSIAGAERRLRAEQHRLHKLQRTRSRRLRPPPRRLTHGPAGKVRGAALPGRRVPRERYPHERDRRARGKRSRLLADDAARLSVSARVAPSRRRKARPVGRAGAARPWRSSSSTIA